MFEQPGIDYNSLFTRLHDGLREFQSWRNHRRQRHADGATPQPSPVVASATPPSPSAGAPGGLPGVGLEPQGFVSIGGRLVPVFGEIQPAMCGTSQTSPSSASVAEKLAPPPPPPLEPKRGPVPSRLDNVAPLNLPPPVRPACLNPNLTPTPPSSACESTMAPSASTTPTQTSSTTANVEPAPNTRTDAEVLRLERVHAEHRSLLAGLLAEHRQALREQAEAAVARQAGLVRELLAEHRAELDKVLVAHSEHIGELLSQHREQAHQTIEMTERVERTSTTLTELSELLARRSMQQAQNQEETAQHIDSLSSFIGDLAQTISLLAVTTYAGKHETTAPASAEPTTPPSVAAIVAEAVAPTPGPKFQTLTMPSASAPETKPRASSPAGVRDCGDDDLLHAIAESTDLLAPPVPSLVAPRAANT